MKKIFVTLICILAVPMLFAVHQDSHDAAVDNTRIEFDASIGSTTRINMIKQALNLTDQTYVGAFLAPDGAIRGLTFDGTDLWAANSGDGNSVYGDKLWQLDASTGAVLGEYDAPGAGSPCGMTWDGTYLWHSDFGTDLVYQIDPSGMTVVKTIPAPNSLIGDLAFDGEYLYGAALANAQIIKFDTITGAQVDIIYATYSSPNVRPFGLAYLPFESGQIWTSDGGYGSNYVNEWDFATSTWIDQWAANPASYPCGLAYDPVSGYMWISCWDTDSIYIWDVGSSGGTEVTWDFEDGTWQDWVHTNGLAYPAGWDVIGSGMVNWPPPDMGSYCLALDDDAAGSGTSVIDTAISPVFTEFAGDWLYWGVGYNNISTDWLDVIIAYGGTYDLVAHYTSDQGGYSFGVWDSADVSGYGPGQYQIMFVYNDGGTWAWWAEIDNIGPVIMGEPDQHDVGSMAFLSPGTQVSPAYYDVIGVTKNYGGFEETYDVHCVVTDPTFATVLDTTINVTTPMGENDTINFGNIEFVDGYTYDLTMATLLSGDENPANDTLEQSTFVTSWFWESWAAIDQGRSGPYAGFWNIDGQSYVYYWGGNPGPLATGFKYDGSGWTAVPSMPIGSSYGGDISYDGKIYLVSAWTGQNGMLSIFDCESETFSSGTNLPTPVADPACALYMDNYIYCIGGSNPPGWAGSTIVQVYDIGSDTWLTGVTQLPSASLVSTAEAGYIGNDTLIVSGGYDAGATNKTTMGAINPANPAEVTWSTGTPHPGVAAYRNFGGAWHNDDGEYWFMVVGGSPYVAQAAIYQSNAGWITAPDKITACSNSGAVAGPWESLTDDAEILLYTVAGYTGAYLNIFEVFHTGIWTGIMEQPDDKITVFDFSARTINPVKDQVRFTLSMPYQGEVNFQVFDVTGRQVIDTRYSSISQGEHTLFWNLKDEQQRKVAAGTYFYRFQTGEHTATGKLVVVR